MSAYIRRIRDFSPDIKRFLFYGLMANIGFGAVELVLNFYFLELGYREDFIGEWRAVQTIAMAIVALLIGPLINRFGPWKVIVGGFSLLTASSVVLAFSEMQWMLLLLAVAVGAGLAFLFNPLMPFVMEYSEPNERQYVSAVAFSVVSFSMMIGSLIGGFSPSFYSRLLPAISTGSLEAYRAAMLTGSLISALGLIPLMRMQKPREAWTPVNRKLEQAKMSIQSQRQTRGDIAIFVAVGGLMSIGVGMVQPFYNVYLKDLGASDDQVGFIYALGGLTAAVIGLGAPAMANRMGSLNAVILLRLSIVPFYLLLIFMPSLSLAIMAFLIRQASISMAWPIDSTFISEILPPSARSGVFGTRSSAWNLGFAFASFAAGRIIVQSGYDWLFVSIVVFSTLSALLFYVYFRRHPMVLSGEIPSALPRRKRLAAEEAPSRFGEGVAESEGKAATSA